MSAVPPLSTWIDFDPWDDCWVPDVHEERDEEGNDDSGLGRCEDCGLWLWSGHECPHPEE